MYTLKRVIETENWWCECLVKILSELESKTV